MLSLLRLYIQVVALDLATSVYDNPSLPLLFMGDMNDLLYDIDNNSTNINRARMFAFRALVKQCAI
jgi:hypothetical protein